MAELKALSEEEKLRKVLQKNTFFLNIPQFEDQWEKEISSIVDLLLLLKRDLEGKNTEEKKTYLVDFISQRSQGLPALLCLFGISQELLMRIVTFVVAVDDPELNTLVGKDKFLNLNPEQWRRELIFEQAKTNKAFARGLVNLFLEGFSVPILQNNLPAFELKNFTFRKLDFSLESLVDSVVRYARKGSYEAEKDAINILLKPILDEEGISYTAGKLKGIPRLLDLIIPDKESPLIVVESSYVVTTSSGMGDKAEFEKEVARSLKQHYPKTVFLGFVDGIGWYVRRGDLKELLKAFPDVFTFHPSEIERFIQTIRRRLPKLS
jgi:hypothetical protein